ncbi:MAG: ABC transporter permease [Bryobacteraceae bacterium]
MSLRSRISNVFRTDRVRREIDEEFESHIEAAIEDGRDPAEVRKAFGSLLLRREECRDLRLIPWLDSLRADGVFGWRQLMKSKVISAAALLSLALGIGACTSAFRLIDALLLRPLPIAHPERLYDLFRQQIGWDGKPGTFDGWAYPVFRQMRAAVGDQAELIAVSFAEHTDLTYKSDQEMEKAYTLYVSGWMFSSFGLRPSLGRLFTENDDREPGAHPYAVLSFDYWTRRFGRDRKVIGRTFRMGKELHEIIGVVEPPFTGTEPGSMIDIFLPTMMNPSVSRSDSTWHRTFALLKSGVAVEPLRERLNAISLAFERERAKGFTNMSKQSIENYLHQTVLLEPAPSGVSDMQNANRNSLFALGVLVALVLLIACANVANVMTARATARAREMALRLSIGAGRWRLVQLVLVESAILAFLAAGMGWVFAWWSAPFVVSMINPPDDPARLSLATDGRVLGFGLALTVGVTFLFGAIPALRVSRIMPASALKGGEDPKSRRRTMHALVASQVAFCFVVVFVAGLFFATFERLSHLPTGFSSERVLALDTVAQRPEPSALWDQVAQRLRTVPGVETVALAGWPLLSGYGWNNSVSIKGGPPSDDLTYFLNVSPGWVEAMKIPFIAGRDFLPNDTYPGVAIVNETFAKRYFRGENPIGEAFDQTADEGARFRLEIVGVVRDARYRGMREAIPPVAYVPFHSIDAKGVAQRIGHATFIVRASGPNPLALASTLRKEVPRARSEFRVSNIRTQTEINQSLTVRERLLAMLALFFASVALLLAGVGLYGVLDYSVLQRRHEIGIRIAIGAQASEVTLSVTAHVFSMVLVGTIAGLVLGMASVRYIESLLYQVKMTDLGILALPSVTILAVALLAALPAVIRAVRIDPVAMLRAE